jgi:hypothetical protein
LLQRYKYALSGYALALSLVALATFGIALVLRNLGARGRAAPGLAPGPVIQPKAQDVLALVLIAILAFQAWWFASYSIWDRPGFFAGQGYGGLYTGLRVFHFAVLAAISVGAGVLVLRGLRMRDFIDRHTALPVALLAAFIGIAAIRLVLFLLGYANLLRIELLGPAAAVVLWVARRELLELPGRLWRDISTSTASLSRAHFAIGTMLASAIAMLLFSVALLNVLYVNNENGDYLTHYGPYYDAVLAQHGIWPNDVWYQYFYSKGEGFGFLSMSLSDRHGKHLSAFLCFTLACLALFDLMRREFKSSFWAALGVIVVVSLFVRDDSGAFAKHHAAVASILVGIAYCSYQLFYAEERDSRAWAWGGALCAMSLVVLSAPAVAYAAVLISGLAVFSAVIRRWSVARTFISWLIVSGVLLGCVLVWNYAVTGLPEITPWGASLKFLNRVSFAEWVSPHLIDYMDQGSAGFQVGGLRTRLVGALGATRLDRIADLVFSNLRLMAVAILVVGVILASTRRWFTEFGLLALIGVLVCGGVVASYLAVSQPVSVYRASVFNIFFATPLVIAIAMVIVRHAVATHLSFFVTTALTVVVIVKAVVYANVMDPQKIEARLSFLAGQRSLADAHALEYGVPPALYELRFKYGKNERWLYLRATNEAGLSHFIGSGVETEVSYSLGPRWHVIAYDTASNAREELDRLGFKYFLLQVGEPVFGTLPYSDLFSPTALGDHFRVVARVGSFVLLTWRNAGEPRDPAMRLLAEEWTRTLSESMLQDLYLRARFIYDVKSSGNRIPSAALRELPPVKGWQ